MAFPPRSTDELVVYRFSKQSNSWQIPRRMLLAVRTAALESRLVLPHWSDGFSIWGAGRDGTDVFKALSPAAQARVRAIGDIDPRKIGTRLARPSESKDAEGVPVIHFSALRPPFITCVALDRTGGEFESNVASLGLVPGRDFWFFS